jgi:hypothetical protein
MVVTAVVVVRTACALNEPLAPAIGTVNVTVTPDTGLPN